VSRSETVDVSIVCGAGNGHAFSRLMHNLTPDCVVQHGDLKIVSDTRILAQSEKIFGGPMPAGCLYAPQTFIDKNPNTTQALANAIVRANKWIQAAGAAEIIKAVPESYLLGDRAVYIDAFLATKGALSPDGLIPEKGAQTAFNALASVDDKLGAAKLDLSLVYTNAFAKIANAKYPKG
jgi:NitT/TauT family transport system substrate-binding protein